MNTITTGLKFDGETNIKIDIANKVIHAKISGKIGEDEAKKFIVDYQRAVKSVKSSEYTLLLNCKDMTVLPKHMLPSLEGAMGMYKEAGFKRIEADMGSNTSITLKMQIGRLSRQINLGIVFI